MFPAPARRVFSERSKLKVRTTAAGLFFYLFCYSS